MRTENGMEKMPFAIEVPQHRMEAHTVWRECNFSRPPFSHCFGAHDFKSLSLFFSPSPMHERKRARKRMNE